MSTNFLWVIVRFIIYIIDLNAKQFSKKALSFKNLKNNNKLNSIVLSILAVYIGFNIIKLIHKKSHYQFLAFAKIHIRLDNHFPHVFPINTV